MRLTLTALGYHLIDLRFCEAVEEDPAEGPTSAVEAAALDLGPRAHLGFVEGTAPGSEPFYPTYE